MVVRLSDSQIAAFESAGVTQDQIGSMIANARTKGIGDDMIYNDLASRANAYATYAGMQIKETDRQVDDQQRENMIAWAEKLSQPSGPKKSDEPIEGAMMRDIRNNGTNSPFFNSEVPNVAAEDSMAHAEQQAAFQYGKDLSWAESFLLHAGDNVMLSLEDFITPEAEMIRAGAAEDNPTASMLGGMAGFVGGLGPKAVKLGYKGIKALAGKGAVKEAEQAAAKTATGSAVKTWGRKALGYAGRSAIDAAIGTAQLAAQDAVRAASKDEEWRTYRMDARRYSDDFINGVGWSAVFGSAGSIVGRWRRGARNAANRFGGVEKIRVLQNERQAKIDAGMDPIQARYEFQRDLLGGLTEEEQKQVAHALRNDPALRQYFNDISVTMMTDIDRSAKMITQREIKKVTDDSMDALKRNQKLGDVDFDTSKTGLIDALGTNSAKNRAVGEDLAKEGNIILTQDPDIHATFKAKTRQAAQMGDSATYNKLIEGAEIGDFPELVERAKGAGMDLNGPEAKGLAQDHVKKMLDEGMDYVSDVNDMKGLIDRLANKGDIQAGKGSKIGSFREGLNETLETAFGDPNNPGNLSGKYRGYHNVKKFEDVMTEAHDFGRNLDPVDQADSLRNFLNSHGNATADEAIAISTAVKMGYLDKLKTLAKEGKDLEWRKAVEGAKKNPQMRVMLGGEDGIKQYMKTMEPEIRAAKSLKNILVSATPGLKTDKMAQEALGTAVAAFTNSPIATTNHLMRIWENIVPGGVTPAVAKQMQQIMDNPTWNNFNWFINTASKDPATRLQLDRVVDQWFHDVSQGFNVGFRNANRYGTQNTSVFTEGE
ncbi:MAG: hypothetical protein J6U92_01015 [Clostridia bacterium]|nr:hypothetical protein [Clostridia bacterium]